MQRKWIILALGILVLTTAIGALVACGASSSGGGSSADGGTSGLQTVTTQHDNGQIKSTGQIDADGQREGLWKLYAESGQLLFTGSYVDGLLDHSQPWTEYNADGSVRFDQSDGEHPTGGPAW